MVFFQRFGEVESLQHARLELMKRKIIHIQTDMLDKIDKERKNDELQTKINDLFKDVLNDINLMKSTTRKDEKKAEDFTSREQNEAYQAEIKKYIVAFKHYHFNPTELVKKINEEFKEFVEKQKNDALDNIKNNIIELTEDIQANVKKFNPSNYNEHYFRNLMREYVDVAFLAINRAKSLFDKAVNNQPELMANDPSYEYQMLKTIYNESKLFARVVECNVPSAIEKTGLGRIKPEHVVSLNKKLEAIEKSTKRIIEDTFRNETANLKKASNLTDFNDGENWIFTDKKVIVINELNQQLGNIGLSIESNPRPSLVEAKRINKQLDDLEKYYVSQSISYAALAMDNVKGVRKNLENAIENSMQEAQIRAEADNQAEEFAKLIQSNTGLIWQQVKRDGNCLLTSTLTILKKLKPEIYKDYSVEQYQKELYNFMETNIEKYKEPIYVFLCSEFHLFIGLKTQKEIEDSFTGRAPLLVAKFTEICRLTEYEQALKLMNSEDDKLEEFKKILADNGFACTDEMIAAFISKNEELFCEHWKKARESLVEESWTSFQLRKVLRLL